MQLSACHGDSRSDSRIYGAMVEKRIQVLMLEGRYRSNCVPGKSDQAIERGWLPLELSAIEKGDDAVYPCNVSVVQFKNVYILARLLKSGVGCFSWPMFGVQTYCCQAGVEAYPHVWGVNASLANLIAEYSSLEDGARIDEAWR